MSRSRLLNSVLAAGAAATTAVGILGIVSPAAASHGGTGSVLSSSNGTSTIRFAGGSTLIADHGVTNAAWSPDGSRAAYIDPDGVIDTLRYDDGQDWITVTESLAVGLRGHPTWSDGGTHIVWAERESVSEPWHLQMTSTTGWLAPQPISPDDDAFHYTHPDFGSNGVLVCQRQANTGGSPTGTPEVVRYEPVSGTFSTVITEASHPAVSPDGERVAFVRAAAGTNQIFTSDMAGGNIVQVTSNSTAKDNPVWSHDGTTIAFNTGTAGAVATAPADGSGAASPTTVAGLTGLPAYQTRVPDQMIRLAGANRFTTATAVSASLWATAGDASDFRRPAESVVLSRSDTFADALGGAALAAAKQGPLLLTLPTSLNASTKTEIARVLGNNTAATVYLLGDVSAISQAVQNEIAAMGYRIVRLAGANRYSTSVAIANAIDPSPDLVLAATGVNFPDALAAGAAAGSFDVPGTGMSAVLVLTADNVLPAATKSYLDSVTANPDTVVFGVGGQGATATQSYGSFPLEGINRYDTALLVGWTFFEGEFVSGVATGTNWPDALAGGSLMATLNGPLLLTPAGNTLSPETAFLQDIRSPSISIGAVFGGADVVSSASFNQVGGWISGPAGFTSTLNPRSLSSRAAGPTAPQTLAQAPASGSQRTPEDIKAAAKAAEKIFSELHNR